ncbi:MAG: hypothetical protein A2X86_16610 [Bdellovibrionales bacterium GWA2_49_15]|nr:MAG: hypothetical protein A2X86_16610 [Bdellovibrionales bacterium GWA2_49_15]HAZ13728.1 MBL fold metallo-hydrolase [Bdellovibrionales bacterium]
MSFKIHHLNCASMCPWSGKLAPNVFPSQVICHCLLVESDKSLVLVDTGLGVLDHENPGRLGVMGHFLGLKQNPAQAAIAQIRALGFSPEDVRHIIPSHLDLDHAGGIVDFPWATVHLLRAEHHAALVSRKFMHTQRYRQCQWSPDTKWKVYKQHEGEPWFGFETVQALVGLPPEILILPLPGHTSGHVGVAIQNGAKWVLHAGDSYYDQNEVQGDGPVIVGWKIFQRIVHEDHELAMKNQKRLRKLMREHAAEVEIFCSHDPKTCHC